MPDTVIWQQGDDLMVRSQGCCAMSSNRRFPRDGTHPLKLPVTPLLTFSVNGKSVHVTPELQ
ncbi:hypothetical protein [Leclercia adecarboxylata]|uniref:hypothetical protein n=1 Tax=Leclercia adecarboxylata TaxID=83655 RepID=UPI00294A4162|nr:hypothetical protein [Leclercia adecarboxylata]MDV5280101.1 DotH/IcmK family type IV secretion protein [Leclercia adecarboxylata]